MSKHKRRDTRRGVKIPKPPRKKLLVGDPRTAPPTVKQQIVPKPVKRQGPKKETESKSDEEWQNIAAVAIKRRWNFPEFTEATKFPPELLGTPDNIYTARRQHNLEVWSSDGTSIIMLKSINQNSLIVKYHNLVQNARNELYKHIKIIESSGGNIDRQFFSCIGE
ncbi:MAG: hypothetical protein ABII22_05000 [Candidatus Micrarchaeota archaeon]